MARFVPFLALALSLPGIAIAREPSGGVEAEIATGHAVQVPIMGCDTTAHETVPIEMAGRGEWRIGALVLRAGAALSADLVVEEKQETRCMYGVGDIGEPDPDEPIGDGNARVGAQLLTTVGGSWEYFGFDAGAMLLTAPLWIGDAPPLLPSLAFRFGPERAHGYFGILDLVPTVTHGGLARTGAVFAVAERMDLDLGAALGPDLESVFLTTAARFRLAGGSSVLASIRVGSRFGEDGENLTDVPPFGLSVAYGWSI